jgi:uncharacterized protein (DUF736 family)
MPFEKDPNELGALWNKFTSGGRPYMTGTIDGVKVVVFENKKLKETHPDWRVLKSVPKDAPKPETVTPPDVEDIFS